MTAPSSASRRPGRARPERHPAGDGRRPSPPPSRFFAPRLAQAWRAGACALAAVLVLLLGGQTAQAQTTVKLVGNVDQTRANIHLFDDSHLAFTTGSNTAGYVLTSVRLEVQSHTGTTGASVSIHENSSGSPGTNLGTLTNPSSFPTSLEDRQFTAPDDGIALSASTTYVVKFDGDEAVFKVTTLDAEDSGAAAGWSIADSGQLNGNANTIILQMAIYGTSTPTVANAIPDRTAAADTAFSYTFPANTFNDADTGDTLTYTAAKSDDSALPSWLTFTASTRTFSGTPQPSDAGTVSVKVTASDGTASVSDTFDIVVASSSAPTVANPIPNQTAEQLTAFSYTFPADTFNDADGDTLTYTAARPPGSFDVSG